MLQELVVAAATLALDYDVAQNAPWKTAPFPRVIRSAAVAGGAAANDYGFAILVGMVEQGRVYNAATGAATLDHRKPLGIVVPPNTPITLRVVDAGATNPYDHVIDIVP